MALPVKLEETFTPAEIAFLAEDEIIEVLPRQGLDSLELLGSDIPRMRPQLRSKVPLWLALVMKKQQRCQIVPPEWLSVEVLTSIYEEEAKTVDRFSNRLPMNWLEIGHILLNKAADDFESPEASIRALLQSVREVRLAKARAGLAELNESHMQLDDLGLMEINEIRPFVGKVMDELRRLRNLISDNERSEFDSSQVGSQWSSR